MEDEFYVPAQTLNQNPNGGVAVVTGKRVTQVDIQNQTVRLDNNWEIAYDKCLIATGGKPKNLGVFESEWTKLKDKVTLFRNVIMASLKIINLYKEIYFLIYKRLKTSRDFIRSLKKERL